MNKPKILFIGHYRQSSGWGNASINYLQAFVKNGYDVVARPVVLSGHNDNIPDFIKELESKPSRGCDVCIQHLLPHHLEYSGHFEKNIAICVYENFNANLTSWPTKINLMDELWVPSKFTKKVFTTSGVSIPIKIVPHFFDIQSYNKEVSTINHPELDGNFIFYTIADLNQRKNIKDIIKAFHLAFTPNQPVRLLLKVTHFNTDPQKLSEAVARDCDKIKKEMKLYSSVDEYIPEIIISSRCSDEQIASIHKSCNAFVTASHGEAFQIPLFEALAYKNHVIAPNGMFDFVTGWDFTYDCNETEPSFGMNDTFFELGSSREQWKHINMNNLVRAMKECYRFCSSSPDYGNNCRLPILNDYDFSNLHKWLGDSWC